MFKENNFYQNSKEVKMPENLEENKNKEKILRIESIKTGSCQKANLVLVLLGQKPGIDLTVYVDTKKEIAEEEDKIKSLKLNYKKISQEEKGGRYVAEFILAKSEDILNELSKTDPSRDHEKFGSLMGYPMSAIKAFLEGNCFSVEEERELLKQHPEIALHDFRLSKDNNKEEIETLKRWNDLLKKEAPDLYSVLKQ